MATTATQRPLDRDRLFFSGMALLILGIVIVGYAPTFYMRPLFPGRPAPPEGFFYLKGVIFSAWFLLLPVQCWLIASKRVALHRTLGLVGASIAVLVVIFGIWGALIAAGRPGGFIAVSTPPLMFLVVTTVLFMFNSMKLINIFQNKEIKMNSINKTARVAGFLYLLVVPLGIFGSMYVPSKLIVAGNAATTADNIIGTFALFLGYRMNTGLFAALGEILFLLWLLIKGVNAEQWEKRALASA